MLTGHRLTPAGLAWLNTAELGELSSALPPRIAAMVDKLRPLSIELDALDGAHNFGSKSQRALLDFLSARDFLDTTEPRDMARARIRLSESARKLARAEEEAGEAKAATHRARSALAAAEQRAAELGAELEDVRGLLSAALEREKVGRHMLPAWVVAFTRDELARSSCPHCAQPLGP